MIKRISKDTYQVGIVDEKGKWKKICEIYGIFYVVDEEQIELHWWGFSLGALVCDVSHLTSCDTSPESIETAQSVFDKHILKHLEGIITRNVIDPTNNGATIYKYEWNGDI